MSWQILGEGTAAKIYAEDSHPGRVLKVLSYGRSPAILRREHEWMLFASSLGISVPNSFGIERWESMTGLAMSRVEGKPWDAEFDYGTMCDVPYGTALSQLHRKLLTVIVPPELPLPANVGSEAPRVRDRRRAKLTRLKTEGSELASNALSQLEALPEGDRLCHGDLHLQNVMGSLERPTIIDWDHAGLGAAEYDVAATSLRLFLMERDDDADNPTTFTKNVRAVRLAYLEGYPLAADSGLDRDALRCWARVQAACMADGDPLLRGIAQGEIDPFKR